MARAYLAAKKRQQADKEDEQTATDGEQGSEGHTGTDSDGGHGSNKDSGGTGDNGGSSDGGGGDGDGDDDDDDDDDSSGEEDGDNGYGPEDDPWMIDPDTDNALAPCAYHFQTCSSAMQYYGPAPEFVGSNGPVEHFTTYRWNNKPGDPEPFRQIPGGFIVPRTSVWQQADARREADAQRAEHIAAGLIRPNTLDDEDSGSDYSTTQQDLKSRGKPVDTDLECESDISSPIKSTNKGKGREVPAIPVVTKAKDAAESGIPLLSLSSDKGRQWGAAPGSSAGAGGRPSLAELATCDALGSKIHQTVTDVGLLYGRCPEVILARLGLAPAATRHTSVWNAFQTLYSLQVPEIPHDGKFCPWYIHYKIY